MRSHVARRLGLAALLFLGATIALTGCAMHGRGGALDGPEVVDYNPSNVELIEDAEDA